MKNLYLKKLKNGLNKRGQLNQHSSVNASGFEILIYKKDNSYKIGSNNMTYQWNNFGATSKSDIVDNNWHFVVATWDGNIAKIYIDGKLENAIDPVKDLGYPSYNYGPIYWYNGYFQDFLIGKAWHPSYGNNMFSGELDELRYYNRALSDSEIKKLYEEGLNNCSGGGYTEADLQKKYSEGFEAGKEYCKNNPSACGISVSSSTDCSTEYQSGYNNGYNKGYEDGKNSCSGSSQENPFLPPTTSSQCATFDFVSNIFSVPCFETGKSTYSLDFKLINTKPVQLGLTNVKKK